MERTWNLVAAAQYQLPLGLTLRYVILSRREAARRRTHSAARSLRPSTRAQKSAAQDDGLWCSKGQSYSDWYRGFRMKARGQRDVTVVTPETLALLELHLANHGIPDMHQQRFQVQTDGAGLYLATWRDGMPVGYVLLHFKHPPHHASHDHYPRCAYVEALDVRAENRRQGFALALMCEAELRAKASGASLLGLSVAIDNGPARALYRKLGYQPTGIPDYVVIWTYLDPVTGEPKEEGELCSFWARSLAV